jgi:hypothetical protein
MLREITNQNPPTSVERIAEFEKRWGFQLPVAYRDFLLKNNGGNPIPDAFPIKGMPLNPFGDIQVFFGLGKPEDVDDLEWFFENLKIPLPLGFLPIAGTPFSDYICLDTSKPKCPVWYWDTKPAWGDGTNIVFYPIADSFDEFLAAIYDHPLDVPES